MEISDLRPTTTYFDGKVGYNHKNWIPQSIFLFLVAFYSGKHVESRYISPCLGQVTSLSSHFLIAMTAALDCIEVAVAIKIW